MHIHVGTSGKSKPWTEIEKAILMKRFQTSPYALPERKEVNQFAELLNVSRKKVENWFVNKRRTLARRGMLPESE